MFLPSSRGFLIKLHKLNILVCNASNINILHAADYAIKSLYATLPVYKPMPLCNILLV